MLMISSIFEEKGGEEGGGGVWGVKLEYVYPWASIITSSFHVYLLYFLS